ncbi:M10 family metallopeptidase C-terminal domain-containing protein, partial [Ancylobacter oerskovii]
MVTKVATQNNEVVNGSEDADELFAGGFNNVTLNGLGDADRLYADGGTGGEFNGGGGDDYLTAGGKDTDDTPHTGGVFNGGDGDDLLDANLGSGGTFNGGNGNDRLDITLAKSATLNGDAGDDIIYGNSATSGTFAFNGGTGYDTLYIDRDVNDFGIVKAGDTVFLSHIGYKANITGIEHFYFYDWDTQQQQEFTLETLGTNPDRATTVAATGNDYIDGLIDGEKWTDEITFSFGPGVGSSQIDSLGALLLGSYLNSWDEIDPPLALYGSAASLVATGIKRSPPVDNDEYGYPSYANDGDIRFQNGTGFDDRYFANPPSIGSVLFNSALNNLSSRTSVGNEQHLVYLQAAGRALGLKSASEAGGIAEVAVPADKDALEYTVMSQRSYPGGPADGDYTLGEWDFPQTFMALDIQALQTLYGADYTTNAGNSVYKWDATGAMSVNSVKAVTPGANKIFLTIWDGGGTDTYDFSNYTEAMSIDLSPGGASLFSQAQLASLGGGRLAGGNVYNAYLHNDNPASLIENALGGSGNDTLRGNIADNVLNGGAGADTMTGLAGNDRYIVDNAGDRVVEAANEGLDRVIVRIADYVLPAHVEEAIAEEGTLATDLGG